MAHPNETFLRKGYDAFARGDLDALRSMFSNDILWHVGGRGPLSGSYKGIDEVFGLFAELVQRSGGTFRNDVHDVVGGEDHAVALTTARAKRSGKTLQGEQVAVFHIRNDKVTEVWTSSFDQHAADEFWA